MKITKRDFRVFVLGMIAFFAIESIYNYKEVKQDISNGWRDGYNGN